MKIADELREMLREEYRITSVEELDAALRKTKGLNIGLFVERREAVMMRRKAKRSQKTVGTGRNQHGV